MVAHHHDVAAFQRAGLHDARDAVIGIEAADDRLHELFFALAAPCARAVDDRALAREHRRVLHETGVGIGLVGFQHGHDDAAVLQRLDVGVVLRERFPVVGLAQFGRRRDALHHRPRGPPHYRLTEHRSSYRCVLKSLGPACLAKSARRALVPGIARAARPSVLRTRGKAHKGQGRTPEGAAAPAGSSGRKAGGTTRARPFPSPASRRTRRRPPE